MVKGSNQKVLHGIKQTLRQVRLCFALAVIIVTVPAIRYQAQASAGTETEPKVVHAEMPVYPALGHSLSAAGAVKITVEIAQDGQVIAAKIVSGHPVLRAATLEAAQKWLFETSDEIALRQAELVFEFTLPHEIGCQAQAVTPYHFKIPVPFRSPIQETVSYLPADSDGQRCEVHGVLLRRDKVDIVYGLLRYKPGYWRAQQRHFPNANSWVGGGCGIVEIVNPCTGETFHTKYAEVLYCPRCRRAETRWRDSPHIARKEVR